MRFVALPVSVMSYFEITVQCQYPLSDAEIGRSTDFLRYIDLECSSRILISALIT